MDVYAKIREDILNGVLAPGEKLGEEKLASTLHVSRTPLREAIRRLTVEGLLIHTPNRGVTVRNYTLEDIIDAYNLRAVVEGYTASLAALNRESQQITRLEEANTKYRTAIEHGIKVKKKETDAILQSNSQFHEIIVSMSKSSYVKNILSTLVAIPVLYRGFYWFDEDDLKTSIQHHNSLIIAIKNGDAEQARVIMASHLYHGRDRVVHYSKLNNIQISKKQGV
ncbi:GntR family transcriptional regulator [Peribacillus sp. NPDC046944]|uniref:GntR family transcriptional regulator n=1 Tax=unclassified Peribacillus TaxID=2675266 RepID=UPI003814B8AB